jgi:uncharacterized membrane protein YgdD (TMEM256/DUF423 family)
MKGEHAMALGALLVGVGIVTPVGGVPLIAAWLVLAWGLFRKS